MKKILAILLLVLATVTIPTMASAKTEHTTNDATNIVGVSQDATQSNNIGTNVAASGDNNNAAVANQNAEATAKNAITGDAATGKAVSSAKSGEAKADDSGTAVSGNAKSDDAKSGNANSGDATNNAINAPTNTADASHNHLTTGDVHNTVAQINGIIQTVPVKIHNNQIIHK